MGRERREKDGKENPILYFPVCTRYTAMVDTMKGVRPYWDIQLENEYVCALKAAAPALLALASQSLDREAEIVRLEDELNRQKAKTEYEAERAGNFENDLDEAKAREAEVRREAIEYCAKLVASHTEPDIFKDVTIARELRAIAQQPAKEPR